MEIFKLVGSIFVDNNEANKSLSKTDDKGKSVAGTLGKMGKTAMKVGGIAAAGLGIIGSAAIGLGKKVGDTADRLLDLNSITGMSTDSIQKWQNASVIAGTSTEAVTNASEKFTKSLASMDSATSKQAEALADLELSLEDIENMDADERMNVLTEALQGVDDKTKRARLGTDLFSSSWQELAPIVDLGVEGLQNAKNNATVFDEESLKSANDFRIAFDSAKKTVSDLAMRVGMSLMPFLNKMVDYIQEHMPRIQEVFGTVFNVIGTVIGTGVQAIKGIIEWVKSFASQNSEQLETIKEKFSTMFEAIGEFFSAFIEWVKGIWEEYGEDIMAVIQTAWDTISSIFQTAINIITDIFNIFAALFKGDWGALWNGIKTLFSDIFTGISNILDNWITYIQTILQTFGKIISDIWSSIWGGIKDTFNSIWQGMVDGIKGFINLILKFVNKMIDGINRISIDIPDWVPGDMESFGFNIPNIPYLDVGTNYVAKDGLAFLHEGEAVVPKEYNPAVGGGSGEITQNITINSPSPLSERQVARQYLKASRQLATEWGV